MADMPAVTRRTGPLFRFDPGWLFVLAGLVICAAGILTPVHHDLQHLERQLRDLDDQEQLVYARLRAYSDFLDQLDAADKTLITRLAAAQLNWMPVGEQPVLLASTNTARVTDWIDASVQRRRRLPDTPRMSTLTELSSGPYRLWLFAVGIFSVFIGLLVGPSALARAAAVPVQPADDDLGDIATLAWAEPTAIATVAAPVAVEEEEEAQEEDWDDDAEVEDEEDDEDEDEEEEEDDDEDGEYEDEEDDEDEDEEEEEDDDEDGEYEDDEEDEEEDDGEAEHEDQDEDGEKGEEQADDR